MRRRRRHEPGNDYWKLSKAPLQVLLFLLPLIAAYEIALPIWAVDPFGNVQGDITARQMIFRLFAVIGIRGEHLPMLILIVVLLAWHVVKKDRWRFEPRVYAWMWFESIIYALPLFVFALVESQFRAGGDASAAMHALQGGGLERYSLEGRLVFSVGAGLYEELVFRLLGLTLLHMLLVDFLDINDQWGTLIAVIVTSLAFAFYHFLGGRQMTFGGVAFFALCGLYLGGLFVYRGFGIAVATHAIYDIMVTLHNELV